jgi:hypothetical protein
MDKKKLAALTNSIVAEIAAKEGIEETEARTLLGIALRKSKDAVVKAAVAPQLTLAGSFPDASE